MYKNVFSKGKKVVWVGSNVENGPCTYLDPEMFHL